MGLFEQNVDPDEGVELTPSPVLAPLGPAALGIPQAAMQGATPPFVAPQRAPLQMPTPPQAPGEPGAMQKILSMALLGLAAGLGPRNGNGIPQGLMQGQHINDVQRQQEFHNQQGQYEQQQQEALRMEALQQQADRTAMLEQQKRQAALQQALMTIKNEVKTLPDKAAYDQRIEGYAGLLQGSGYRLDANWLRQAVPYIAPSGKKVAEDALQAFFKNPLTQQQMKTDPNAIANGSIKIDLNGDGVPELVPVRKVMEAAGMSVLADDSGKPVGLTAGTQGDLKHVALDNMIKQFKAENRRDPDPKEMVALVGKAEKIGKEPKAIDPSVQTKTDDADAIADAIVDGSQPPDLSRLYGTGAHVRASLARKGYNLTAATQDWTASQKFLATANSSQQVKMRQGIDNAYHSLDVIDQLAQQWQGGKFPLLNKGRLAAARSGALGPEAQKIATQLEAQIADVTAELGNVYMGGNSPTDHALGLAAKNLSSDWSLPTLQSALKLARANLQIRQNSMKNVGPVGVNGGTNQYATPAAPAATGGTDEEWIRDPRTGKMVKK